MAPGTRAGTVIENKYRLDEQIGHGGMGAVYRGTQLAVDRPVAVKLLHPNYAGHKKIQARFEVEAKAIARLNHPNCITLFDFGYSEAMGAFYTVVEFIDGTPLQDLIPQAPSVARVVELIRQIASALGHAHHHGILHRDLKPENIMVARMTDGKEIVKVLDFGIAQIMKGSSGEDDDDFEADRLTRVGEVFGTPPYMSPEQTRSSRDLTPAADLYSLGIIFYELLEGHLPFVADSPMEILGMHLNDPPPPMVRPDVPESLKAVIMRMLAKNPAERPQTGGQVIELLEEIPLHNLSRGGSNSRSPRQPRPSEPTLLSPPEESQEFQARNVATELDTFSDNGAQTRLDLDQVERDLDQQLAAKVKVPHSQQRALASADATGTLPIPDNLHAPAAPVDSGPKTLTEIKKKESSLGTIAFILLFFFAIGAFGFWYLNGLQEPSEETLQFSVEPSPSESEPQPLVDSPEIDDDAREVHIGLHGDEDLDEELIDDEEGDDQDEIPESPSAISPPPPTRPATQGLEEPRRPRQTQPRRPRRESTESGTGSIRVDPVETEEDAPRRPARLGL